MAKGEDSEAFKKEIFEAGPKKGRRGSERPRGFERQSGPEKTSARAAGETVVDRGLRKLKTKSELRTAKPGGKGGAQVAKTENKELRVTRPQGKGGVRVPRSGPGFASRENKPTLKEALEDVKERKAMEEDLEDQEEVMHFWENFFGHGVIATFLTKVTLLGVEHTPDEFFTGSAWGDIEKYAKDLKDQGLDLKGKVAAHRLDSVKKIKEALARNEDKVEFDLRAENGVLYLSHNVVDDKGEDRRFENVLPFLAASTCTPMVDLKEMDAAKLVIEKIKAYDSKNGTTLMQRCMFMSYNPFILDYVNQNTEASVSIVFHYYPLVKAPVSVKIAVGGFGSYGVGKLANIVSGFYPGKLFTNGAKFAVGEDWKKMQEYSGSEEVYCTWDEFPPSELIEKIRAGNPTREIYISVPYNLRPDGLDEWAEKMGVKIMLFEADSTTDTAEALMNGKADIVMSESSDDVDRAVDGGAKIS